MILLHLVRHAQQNWNRETPDAEWPLTELGRKQARGLVKQLELLQPHSIWCSKTLRSVQTMQPFSEHSGIEIKSDIGLGERRITWPLPPMDEMKEHYRKGWEDLDYSLPEGESNREGQTRFMKALKNIVLEEEGIGNNRSIIVCAHGNVIALAEHAVKGTFGNVNLDYCEKRTLTLAEEGWQLIS